MTTITITLAKLPGQEVDGDRYVIDTRTREVQGPAMHDPHALLGFQAEAEVQRVMMFADELWLKNPHLAVGMFPVFSAKRGGIFAITLPVESLEIEGAAVAHVKAVPDTPFERRMTEGHAARLRHEPKAVLVSADNVLWHRVHLCCGESIPATVTTWAEHT